MKISLNWIQDYIKTTLTPAELEAGLTDLGLEATCEEQELSYTDVVLGFVSECGPHPNSDHLSLCQVDIGDGTLYDIVCGAPNVRKGIHVPVAKVGATLNFGEFKIKKAKLRGVKSNGMICSGKELQLNEDHEGIMILDTDAEVGTPVEQILDFDRDAVFDLDLTPNRGDCFSHLGAAREIALLEKKTISERTIKLEEADDPAENYISVEIEAPEACPRYAARVVKDVKIGPSPQWLADRMTAIGQHSVNNVVDAANYVLMDTGHPMHTFDLADITAGKIVVRYARPGEKIVLLDEVEHELQSHHLLICNGEKPVALGGVMGGLNSGIHDDTVDILIESAYFNPGVVRKGAKTLDLSTEASKRFERDTDVENAIHSINQLAALITEVAGGTVCRGIVDSYPLKKEKHQVSFSNQRCNSLLGTDIPVDIIDEIFTGLRIEFTRTDDIYQCIIPYSRNDLEREVDLIEEVARVYGYNNLPNADHYTGSYDAIRPNEQALHKVLRSYLAHTGFCEHYSNSLVPESHTGYTTDAKPVVISNPLSQDMACLRTALIPGMLSAVSYNEKRQQSNFKLFELGAVHIGGQQTDTRSREDFHLGMIWYGTAEPHWRNTAEPDFYFVKGELEALFTKLRCPRIRFVQDEVRGYQTAVAVKSKKIQLGVFGIPEPEILKALDIDHPVLVFEGSLTSLKKAVPAKSAQVKKVIPFPASHRDISILADRSIPYDKLLSVIRSTGGELLKSIQLTDLYENPNLGEDKRNLTFALHFQADNKTLKDETVNKLVTRIVQQLVQNFNAIQR